MSDLYLMKEVITLKKIQVAVKTFAHHRKVDAILIVSAKITREASLHLGFLGNCPPISYKY